MKAASHVASVLLALVVGGVLFRGASPHPVAAALKALKARAEAGEGPKSGSGHLAEVFKLYLQLQNKHYKSLSEFNFRMKVFRDNLRAFVLPGDDLLARVRLETSREQRPRLLIVPDKRLSVDFGGEDSTEGVQFELNKFSDLSDREFENLYLLDQSFFGPEKFPAVPAPERKTQGLAAVQQYLARLEQRGVSVSPQLRQLYLEAPAPGPKQNSPEPRADFTRHFSSVSDDGEAPFSPSDPGFSRAEDAADFLSGSHPRLLQRFQMHHGRGSRRWGSNRHQSYSRRFMDSPLYPTNRESYRSYQSDDDEYISSDQRTISIDGVRVPTYLNWRDLSAMTPVKDQFKCNACYAFSAVAAVEAHHKIRTGGAVSLAEQEIVDCSRRNKGCVGGLPHLVYEYIQSHGISYTSDYRYDQARHLQCRRRSSTRKFSGGALRGYRNLGRGLLGLIKELSNGPIATISFASFPFKQYRGGIYRGQGCYGKTRPNHSSLLVGYKLTGSQKYLLFKNGWGTDWGERGYYKVQLGRISSRNYGHCLIASTIYNSIPIM